jgi:hypothetical protein
VKGNRRKRGEKFVEAGKIQEKLIKVKKSKRLEESYRVRESRRMRVI